MQIRFLAPAEHDACLAGQPRGWTPLKLLYATALFAAEAAILVFGGGCLQPATGLAGVRVWAVPECRIVLPNSLPEQQNEIFTDADRSVRIQSAVGEIVCLQIALRSNKNTLIIGDFSLADLRQGEHVIPAGQARFYRQRHVPVDEYPAWFLRLTQELRAYREYPDVLVPLFAPRGGLPIEVQPGRTEAIWLDIHVPPGTPPGNYQGAIRIAAGGRDSPVLNLSLEVWPFALPQSRHLAMVAGLSTTELLRHHVQVGGQPYAPARLSFEDPVWQQAVSVIDGAVRTLHDHRLSPVLTDVYPLTRLDAKGKVELDWADYDRLITGIVEGTLFEDRTAAVAWPIPVGEKSPLAEAYGGWGSPAYQQALAEHLRQSAAHFREKGWFDQHFVWMPLPGPELAEQYEQFELFGATALGAEDRLSLLCTLAPQPMSPYGWQKDPFRDVSRLVGTWCPPASVADPAELRRARSAGKAVWFTPDRPPFAGSLSLVAPALHARSIPWQAYRFGCSGVLLPAVNDWGADGTPKAENSEAALLWPGTPYGLAQPVPSLRLKRLLRGLQDYEYLWLLEQNRRPAVAQLIAADLFAYGGTLCYGDHCLDGRPDGWAGDPSAWSLARRLMARELIAAFEEEQAGDTGVVSPDEDAARFEQQIEWARLTGTVRGMRATVEGVRLDIDPNDAQSPVRIEATLSLYNAMREPFSGRVGFVETPENWEVDRAEINNLEPRRFSRRIISARAPMIAANPDGVLDVQIGLESDHGRSWTSPARISAITSQRLTTPIKVDGRLDDWPLGTTNVAGDFVLVGALDVPKQGGRSPDRPSQGTIVFVCHDRDYLYVGFNCADDRLSERVVSRGNTVRYDELWPTGEDLVEVVLDPARKAVDPGGLLHFLVKANGAVISEQGAPCLADVARYSDWPAEVIAAVDDSSQADRWTVEIRIPLRALAARPGVWGVNFGRFNARLGEYSSWSGARRYLYSPASLGNLRMEY